MQLSLQTIDFGTRDVYFEWNNVGIGHLEQYTFVRSELWRCDNFFKTRVLSMVLYNL